MADPLRGEVWSVDLNPTRGREQRGSRPSIVVSNDNFNNGPADLIVIVPLTGTYRGLPLHVKIDPPEGGLRKQSFAKCEDVRSVSKERLTRRWGNVTPSTMAEVANRLRMLLDL
jgi:mRNA interferase MazF